MHHKVAVAVWTVDPENNRRYLMRHNKPFNGYPDEWTITFGNVDEGETIQDAAPREVWEEFGIRSKDCLEVKDLNYLIEYVHEKVGPIQIHFFAIQVKDLDIKVVLNEESIGYDWKLLDDAKSIMKRKDESKVFDLI